MNESNFGLKPDGTLVLSRGMLRLLSWIAFSSILYAFLFMLGGESPGGAYAWVIDVMGKEVLITNWIISGVFALAIIFRKVNASARYFVLAIYCVTQGMFAYSILNLYVIGDASWLAVIGACQWAGYGYFSLMSLIDRPRGHTLLNEDGAYE